tara:strand:+ start:4221 stop:4727 length:507 start_codon:yes stop_codon:yes gene_type:complete
MILQNTSNIQILEKEALPYHKYIAVKNDMVYKKYKVNFLENIVDNDVMVGINNYCILKTLDLKGYIKNLMNNYHLILPTITEMPLNLIPFIAKNSQWILNFFNKYHQSNTDSLKTFIDQNDLLNCKYILFSDEWSSYSSKSIVQNLVNLDLDSVAFKLNSNNIELELV